MQTLPALALTLALLPCVFSMYTAGKPSAIKKAEACNMPISTTYCKQTDYRHLSAGDKVKVLTAKSFNSAILQSDVPAVRVVIYQLTKVLPQCT